MGRISWSALSPLALFICVAISNSGPCDINWQRFFYNHELQIAIHDNVISVNILLWTDDTFTSLLEYIDFTRYKAGKKTHTVISMIDIPIAIVMYVSTFPCISHHQKVTHYYGMTMDTWTLSLHILDAVQGPVNGLGKTMGVLTGRTNRQRIGLYQPRYNLSQPETRQRCYRWCSFDVILQRNYPQCIWL